MAPTLEFDFLIVGARCAGAATAIALGQKGFRVCLIDRAKFPSDTLSTHIFGDWELLERLGVTEQVKAAGAPLISRFRVELEDWAVEGPVIVTPYVSGLRRFKLDQILLERATTEPSVTFRQGCSLVDLLWEEGRVVGALLEEADQRFTVRAKVVIGADGRRSRVAHLVEPEEYLSQATTRPVYYAYFRNVRPLQVPTMEFHWHGDDLVLINPNDDGLHCLVVMPPEGNVAAWKGNASRLMMERVRSINTLQERFAAAEQEGPVRGSVSLRSYLRRPFGPGWALVGDAGAAVHPCTGVGMDHAFASGLLLADQLEAHLQGGDWTELMTEYMNQRDKRVRPNLEYGVRLAAKQTPARERLQWLGLLFTLPGLAWEFGDRAPEVVQAVVGPERATQYGHAFGLEVLSHV